MAGVLKNRISLELRGRLQFAATRRNVKAWGIAPGIRTNSNIKALKGRNHGMLDHFAPFGALAIRFVRPQGVALGYHIL